MNDQPTHDKELQGEGSYDASRRYDKAATDFAKSGKVDEAARAAQPASDEEARSLERAEQEGKAHAKGEDPAVNANADPAAGSPKP